LAFLGSDKAAIPVTKEAHTDANPRTQGDSEGPGDFKSNLPLAR
jgi:hypothetical protein